MSALTDIVKTPKAMKVIKFGAIILAVIVAFNLISGIFGDKNAKKAEKLLQSEISAQLEAGGCTNVKIKTNAIAKNKDAHLYCFDTTISCKLEGEKVTDTSFTLVYFDGTDGYILKEYSYEKDNKKDIKDVAIARMTMG